MRILLTNNTLDGPAGTELYVRDVAVELRRRGHETIAYSRRLGEVAAQLRAGGVMVVDRLEKIQQAPDIIHGHHHYETQTAILNFPTAPAISFCHGWQSWQEAGLQSPAVKRYVALNPLCMERLRRQGISADRIELHTNFFDARRFKPRDPLPARARRALAFGNNFTESGELAALREGCRRRGIELDAIGIGCGNVESQPGARLGQYDIVFARGRAAIEALATGTAVVLCGYDRLGPWVTETNFAELRTLNFGFAAIREPLTGGRVARLLGDYNARDAARVTSLTREQCEIGPAVDRLVGLYERTVREAVHGPAPDITEVTAAAARYLEEWSENYKDHVRRNVMEGAEGHAPDQVVEALREKMAGLERDLHEIKQSLTWRWSQRVLRHPLTRAIAGGAIEWLHKHGKRAPTESAATPPACARGCH